MILWVENPKFIKNWTDRLQEQLCNKSVVFLYTRIKHNKNTLKYIYTHTKPSSFFRKAVAWGGRGEMQVATINLKRHSILPHTLHKKTSKWLTDKYKT